MDPITHTIISVVSLAVAFYLGKHQGTKTGIAIGVLVITEFFKTKLGAAEMAKYEKEFAESMGRS